MRQVEVARMICSGVWEHAGDNVVRNEVLSRLEEEGIKRFVEFGLEGGRLNESDS